MGTGIVTEGLSGRHSPGAPPAACYTHALRRPVAVPVYSHSRLSTFEKCPLQFRYRYIDKIKRDTQGIEAFLGIRVHETLEKVYRDVDMEKVPSLDEVLNFYRERWKAEYSERITIVKTEYDPAHYRSIGERCLADYYDQYAPFDQGRTLGLEERIALDLGGDGRYRIRGFIDRLARSGPGIYEIHDYKTSSSLPAERDLRADRQLSFYQMAVQERFPDAREVRLIWHYLAFNQELHSSRTPEQLRSQSTAAMRLIDRIEAETEFPPHVSPLCRWCDYRDICPVQKHLVNKSPRPRIAAAPGLKDAAVPRHDTTPRPGQGGGGEVRPIDRLVELRTRRDEIDREIAQVEDAIHRGAGGARTDSQRAPVGAVVEKPAKSRSKAIPPRGGDHSRQMRLL